MASLRRHEGYLSIDHRASPGTPEAPEGTLLERAVITCRHCQVSMIRNPARTRPRAYCPGCDHYICDACELIRQQTLHCQDIERVFDQLQSDAIHHRNTFAEKVGT